MAPTLVTSYTVNSNGSNNTALSTPNFTPAQHEFIVVTVTTSDSNVTLSGVSATANSPVFTSKYASTAASNCAVYMWVTRITQTLPASMQIQVTASGTAGYRHMVVSRWSSATSNSTVASATSNTTGSATITTTATGSAVVWAAGDWNGVDGDAVYRSGATELGVYFVDGEFAGIGAWQAAPTSGAQTYGISGLSGPKFHFVAVELSSWTPISATFVGQGSLNPNPSAAAALIGTGKLTVINSTAPFIGSARGKLVASPTVSRQVLAALIGNGGLSIGGLRDRAAQVALSGTGALVATLTRAHQAQADLVGASSLVVAGGLDLLTGPALTAENVVGYFALRDLGLLTGDASYNQAADAIGESLLSNHWNNRTQRFGRGMGDNAESLMGTALGGLFLTATGEYERARAQIRHLRRYRVKGRAIDAFHIDGPSGLQGYRPYGEFESGAFTSPPAVIDQAGSWLALLFASRFGEPIGEDIRSLARWRYNEDDSSYLYGAQWLRCSTDGTGTTPTVQARPYLGSAAWAYLLSQGAVGLLGPDSVALPVVTTAALVSSYDYGLRRLVLTAAWTRDTAPCAAYELVLESSTNNGSTWSQAQNTVRDSIERARVGTGYRYVWKLRMPANSATRYRIRVRLRNARFGAWVTSSSVVLPSI